MKLKHPSSNVEFNVTPAYFLGDFDIYDREEELGAQLNAFDPNDEDALDILMDEYFFRGGRVAKLQSGHKAELLRMLSEALADKQFDFAALLRRQDELGSVFALPASWLIRDPRDFFGKIYRLAVDRWKGELGNVSSI